MNLKSKFVNYYTNILYVLYIMANLVDYLNGKIRPYRFYISIAIVIVVFVMVSIYGYQQLYLGRKKKQFSDVANESGRKDIIEVMFFNVDWCPHCVKAKPEWQSFADQYNGKTVNNYKVECRDVNCTEDSDPSISTMISDYKIESYPTIIIMKGSKRYDFDAKVTKSALEQFVDSASKN
jgi:thiol-disulfide isomerase/thioredoxin